MATIEAAGVLFISPTGRGLFLLRGPGGDSAYQWCVPGGKAEGEEDAAATAIRETEEECGRKVPKKDLALLTRSISPRSMPPAPPVTEPDVANLNMRVNSLDGAVNGADAAPVPEPELVDWTTFAVRVDAEFTPEPDDEHEGYAWAPLSCPPEPLHPGVRTALERLTANELGVARMMAEGRITSPQRFANVMLWDMRITGTGYTYRRQRKEHVWRTPEEWLTEDLVARCNGMPVIMAHPKDKALLDSKEFNKRIVGMVFLPYIKPAVEEVWGITKVYDDAANEMLEKYQLSTSPGVLVGADSQVFKHPGGKTTLVESDPLYVDHLAIEPLGAWDDGEPEGVRLDSADFRESEHPRDEDGKFSESGGGGGDMSGKAVGIEPRNPDSNQESQLAVTLHGKRIGEITLDRGGWFVDRAQLEPGRQGQGLARHAYNVIEKKLGHPLVPSPLGLSEQATAFWKKRLAAMPAEKAAELIAKSREIGKGYGLKDEHLDARLNPLIGEGADRGSGAGGSDSYPMAPTSEWYGDANYKQTGGEMTEMSPDEFLAKARPMEVDEVARENIDDLKAHIQSGKTLDPLALYPNGKEDGRHRAHAAKELGIAKLPVLQWPNGRGDRLDSARLDAAVAAASRLDRGSIMLRARAGRR